jgi:hypothetical protein
MEDGNELRGKKRNWLLLSGTVAKSLVMEELAALRRLQSY